MSDIFKTKQNNQWVGIPALIGPQGPRGPEGQQGPQGETGQTGAAAGIGSVTATATTLPAGSSPTASATCSGPDTNKSFAFTFGLPASSAGGTYVIDPDVTLTSSQYIDLDPTTYALGVSHVMWVSASSSSSSGANRDFIRVNDSSDTSLYKIETTTSTSYYNFGIVSGNNSHYSKFYGLYASSSNPIRVGCIITRIS